MINSDEAFRAMKSVYGKRKTQYPESKYTFDFFTENGRTTIDGENIPTSFSVLTQLLTNPIFLNFELKKDDELFSAGKLKEFVPEEKIITPQPVSQTIETSPLDIMRATFEMNRLYADDIERVNKKYSQKFAEYDQEVDIRINKQKEAVNEKLESIEFANKRKIEIQEEEFKLERKRWDLEKEQILARRKFREDKFSFNALFGKAAEGALEALSANPEQSVNLMIQLVKVAGKAWRGEGFEIPVESAV